MNETAESNESNNKSLWQMDLVNANKSITSLITTMVKFWPNNLQISDTYFDPPTIVWTGRYNICNDMSEVIEYEQDTSSDNPNQQIIISRFPGMKQLCTKHEMGDRLNIMRSFYPKQYSFYPTTFNIHTSMQQITKLFDEQKTNETNHNNCYIIKTGVGCQGTAISIVFTLSDIFDAISYYTKKSKQDSVPLILQKYCNNPLLTTDGFKFDFRIYVVIKSLDPFEFYICRHGLCRICTIKYQPVTRENAKFSRMHFTNYSVNKEVDKKSSKRKKRKKRQKILQNIEDEFEQISSPTNEMNATSPSNKQKSIKRSIDSMLFEIKQQYKHEFDVVQFWKNIDEIVHKTVITLALPLKWRYAENFESCESSKCFHIIGFDILMDSNFKLWLIEINDSPSFGIDSQIDFNIKSSVMETTFSILGVLKETNVRNDWHQNMNVANEIKMSNLQIVTNNDESSQSTMDDLYSNEEKETLRSRHKEFKLALPSNEWYRRSDTILERMEENAEDCNLFRLFEDPFIERLFSAYSTRYGYMNGTKFIQFAEDFGLPRWTRCRRSNLDLLYRDYQAKICGTGGGEVDLEGFCHVLLTMVHQKKRSRSKKSTCLLAQWFELLNHLNEIQKSEKTF